MSSGHGLFTEKGRCFEFWQDFLKCHNTSIYPSKQCTAQAEDYFECLHHTKEVFGDYIIIVFNLVERAYDSNNKRNSQETIRTTEN